MRTLPDGFKATSPSLFEERGADNRQIYVDFFFTN